jgi:hypothetical protein
LKDMLGVRRKKEVMEEGWGVVELGGTTGSSGREGASIFSDDLFKNGFGIVGEGGFNRPPYIFSLHLPQPLQH